MGQRARKRKNTKPKINGRKFQMKNTTKFFSVITILGLSAATVVAQPYGHGPGPRPGPGGGPRGLRAGEFAAGAGIGLGLGLLADGIHTAIHSKDPQPAVVVVAAEPAPVVVAAPVLTPVIVAPVAPVRPVLVVPAPVVLGPVGPAGFGPRSPGYRLGGAPASAPHGGPARSGPASHAGP